MVGWRVRDLAGFRGQQQINLEEGKIDRGRKQRNHTGK
jgi:hypothetical protein